MAVDVRFQGTVSPPVMIELVRRRNVRFSPKGQGPLATLLGHLEMDTKRKIFNTSGHYVCAVLGSAVKNAAG
jgi:hypothetical protein